MSGCKGLRTIFRLEVDLDIDSEIPNIAEFISREAAAEHCERYHNILAVFDSYCVIVKIRL